MNNPTVSVVMPVYNREKTVIRAIQSIVKQTLHEFELIIVDDGSQDSTPEIVLGIRDERVKLTKLPTNYGAWMARNIGIGLARGEFIATMDSDDVALPDRLTRQVAYLREHQDVDILGTRAIRVQDGRHMDARHHADHAIITALLLRLDGSSMWHPTTMIRSEFLKRTGVRYMPEPTDDDHRFWIEAMANGARFAVLQETLLEYHRHDQNLTLPSNPAYAGHFRRKTPMRVRLLGLFFPELSHAEATAIANLMEEGRQHSLLDVCVAISAVDKASRHNSDSQFGESREILSQLLKVSQKHAMSAISNNRLS